MSVFEALASLVALTLLYAVLAVVEVRLMLTLHPARARTRSRSRRTRRSAARRAPTAPLTFAY